MPHQLPLLIHVELVIYGLSRRFLRVQNPIPNKEMRHVKTLTLTLDYYQTMLNIRLLGNGDAPFLLCHLLLHY